MTTNSKGSIHGIGAAIIAILGLSIVVNKGVYLARVNATTGEFMLGLLPAILIALIGFGCYLAIDGRSPAWMRRMGKSIIILVMLALAIFSTVAAVGFWKTGSLPRLQLFQGLTWDILAPSVIEILHKQWPYLVIAMLAVALLLWLATLAVARVQWGRMRLSWLAMAGLCALALLVAAVFGTPGGASKYANVVAAKFFRSDLDLNAAISEKSLRIETAFFDNYQKRLGDRLGPRYPQILAKLKGSNIIHVVLESTRARDVPLYGGSADMPELMQARKHMILLKNLYSQDPRSTKALVQMDMGRFSLLSWDSYSNNIPWMFPKDGLASYLDKLGYRTISLVNSDAHLDHNKVFQQDHGYRVVMYRQALNPGTRNADDMRLLQEAGVQLDETHGPFYMMLWPIETHHPYGREYWAHQEDWLSRNPDGLKHNGASDHARYLESLHEVDDWFGKLIDLLKRKGVYENTVIIVTGDHGEAFGEHEPGNVFHGNGVYQESVHVAGFIYSPKIDGLHVDERNIRMLDIPATILQVATGDQYLLAAGRSIFDDYKYAMPIYLFNSWAGASGIIYDGYKLWRRESPGSEVHLASIEDIRKDPSKELQPVNHDPRAGKMLEMLDAWEAAMKARTVRLLTVKASSQPRLDDVIRVYCDDGKGFRENLKFLSDFSGVSVNVNVPVGHDCKTLRIAPLENTKIPGGEKLGVTIEKLEVNDAHGAWSPSLMQASALNGLEVVDGKHFSIAGTSAYFDLSLGKTPVHVNTVVFKAKFVWRKRKSN